MSLDDQQSDQPGETIRQPQRHSASPGRVRKKKARRASQQKLGGQAVEGMHRRGSKRGAG